MNGDGILDLVGASSTQNSIIIRRGNGDGTFAAGTSYALSGTTNAVFDVGDLDGDGKPDVVVATSTGVEVLRNNGSGGLVSSQTISIAGTTSSLNSYLRVVDLDGDGTLEIVLNDWTFAYWKVAFAQSPAPKIVLRYNGSQWVFDPKLTISKNLDRSLNTKLDRQISDGFKQTKTNRAFGDLGETGAPVVLWTRMLDLIYSGRAKKAESLVNNIWPNDNKYKSEFLSQFTKQLTESPYYSGLKAMIPSPAPFFK
jgi:hypothetical protein